MRALMIVLTLTLPGCKGQFELGRIARAAPEPEPVAYPAPPQANGGSPIETLITGLSEAQQVRSLERQLAR